AADAVLDLRLLRSEIEPWPEKPPHLVGDLGLTVFGLFTLRCGGYGDVDNRRRDPCCQRLHGVIEGQQRANAVVIEWRGGGFCRRSFRDGRFVGFLSYPHTHHAEGQHGRNEAAAYGLRERMEPCFHVLLLLCES